MIYGIITIWLLLGLLGYGQEMGSTKAAFEEVLGITKGDVVRCVIFIFLGPIGLFAIVMANKQVLGHYWFTPSWQITTSEPTNPRFR